MTIEWLQMDKAVIYFPLSFGTIRAEMGSTSKKNQVHGGLGFAFLTAVEVMDGYSAEWGASSGDIIANAAGTALYISHN
jgi:hypothetical protein